MRLGMGLGLGNLLSGQPLTGFPNDFSFNFDGSNDYLETSTINEEFKTVSFWFKPDSTINYSTSGKSLCGFGGNNFNLFIGAGFGVLTNEIITLQDGSNYHYYASTSLEFSNTSWTHLAVVWNASSSKYQFYVNGVLKDTTSHGSGVGLQSNNPIIVGARSSKAEFFDGEIDEFSIWNESLSSDDISKICSKPLDLSKASTYATDRTANLKLWLRAGDKVLPEEDKSIARSDFYTDFDGLDDHIELGSITSSNPLSLNGSHGSVIFWVNIPDVSAGDDHKRIIDKSDAGSAGKGYAITIRTDGSINAYIAGGSMITSDAGEITDAEWFHIVWKWDGTNHKLYKNGIEIKSASSSTTPPSDTANMAIGSWNHSDGRELNGSLSSVSVYQTALDAQTIKQFAKSRYTPMRDNRFSVVDFDGSNDYISIADNDSLDQTSALTIVCWAKNANSGISVDEAILGKYTSTGSDNRSYYLSINSSEKLVFYASADGTSSVGSQTSDSALSTINEWHQYAVTFSSGTCKLFQDGVEIASTASSMPSSIYAGASTLLIGAINTGALNWEGQMSSVSIYSTAKSAEEVYAIYQQGITYNESSLSGLQAYYRMGSDTSKAYPTIADSSSNSNDGTMTSMASDDIVQQMVAGYDMGAFESTGQEVGGDTLAGVGIFDTDTTSSWSTVNTSISYNSSGFMRSVFSGTSEGGVHGGAVLTIGKNYNVTFKAKSDRSVKITSIGDYENISTTVLNPTLTTSFQNYEFNISPTQTLLRIYIASGGSADDFLDLKDIRLKEVLQSADLSDTYPAIIDVNEPVLGVNVVDNNVAARWIAEGTNSDADITNGVRLTFGNNATGNYAVINDALLSTSGLTVGKIYKTTFTASYSGGSSAPSVRLNDGTNNYDNVITTTATEYEVYFNANSADGAYLQIINQVTSNVTDLINWEIKEVQGNVGTMTQMDGVSNLVYSSVLPDQSFLTGVNSAYNFLDFDGTDANVSFGNIELAGEFTLISWIYINSFSVGKAFVIWGDTDNNDWFRITSATTADIKIANSQSTWTHGATFTTGEWQHIAVVRNSSNEVSIYRNGIHYNDNAPTKSGTFVPEVLGRKDNQYLDGNLSNNALYNKQLSSIEISAIYTSNRHTNLLDSYSDNLKAYFAFGALDAVTGLADTDSTIYDRSGNSNHGTTSGTATGDLKSPPNAEPNGYAKGDTNRSTTIP